MNSEAVDFCFSALDDEQRRDIVSVVGDQSGPISLDELATAVAASETSGEPPTVHPDAVETVRITLHHNHLPKLTDADVLTVDPNEGTVDRGPKFDAVKSVLRTVSEEAESSTRETTQRPR